MDYCESHFFTCSTLLAHQVATVHITNQWTSTKKNSCMLLSSYLNVFVFLIKEYLNDDFLSDPSTEFDDDIKNSDNL